MSAAFRSTPRVSENAESQLQTLSSSKFAPNNTTTNLLSFKFNFAEVHAGMVSKSGGFCFYIKAFWTKNSLLPIAYLDSIYIEPGELKLGIKAEYDSIAHIETKLEL